MKKIKELEINSKEEYDKVKHNIQAEKSPGVSSMNDIHLSKLVLDEENINLDFFFLKINFLLVMSFRNDLKKHYFERT